MGIAPEYYLTSEWLILGFTSLFVITRLDVRACRGTWAFLISNVFLVLSLAEFSVLATGDLITMIHGENDFQQYNDVGYAKWQYAAEVIFDGGFYFSRFSLLALYYEILPKSEHRLRIFLYTAIAYNVSGFFIASFVDIFSCSNISQNWSDDSTCALISSNWAVYITWPVGIIAEIFILLLPFPLLRKLKPLERREKFVVAAASFMIMFTIAVSVTRFSLMASSYYGLETYLMGSTEIATQIMVASLPALMSGVIRDMLISRSQSNRSTQTTGSRSSLGRKSYPDSIQKQNTITTMVEHGSGGFTDLESQEGTNRQIQFAHPGGSSTREPHPP